MNRRQLRSLLKTAWKKEEHFWELKERSKENWDQLYRSQREKLMVEIHLNGFSKKAEGLNCLVKEIRDSRTYWLDKWYNQSLNCSAITKQLRNL